MPINGFSDPRFQRLRYAFAESFEGDPADMNIELGASLAVYARGGAVVDLWGGHLDDARDRPWREDSIVCVQSVGKGVLATCAHILIERGKLELDRPVADYWPEFAQAGKADIPVREHVLKWPRSWAAQFSAIRLSLN